MNNDILMLIQMLQNGDIAVNASADSVNYQTWIDNFKVTQRMQIFPLHSITFRYYKQEPNYNYTLIKSVTKTADQLADLEKQDGRRVSFNFIVDDNSDRDYYDKRCWIYIGDTVANETPDEYRITRNPDYQQMEFLDLNGNSLSMTCSITGDYYYTNTEIYAYRAWGEAPETGLARLIMDYYVVEAE